jgi:hypothetical protein
MDASTVDHCADLEFSGDVDAIEEGARIGLKM